MGATELLLVRHGESLSNAAADAAEAAGAEVIEIAMRDPDVPLTDLGVRQAEAVGAWLATLGPSGSPHSIWCSPYVRAPKTARIAVAGSGLPLTIATDARLRDRELGILDLLTTAGVEARAPEEAARRVLVVCHDAVILVLRYICEGLTEADVLAISETAAVRNASVTRLVRPDGEGRWTVDVFNLESHLGEARTGRAQNAGGESTPAR